MKKISGRIPDDDYQKLQRILEHSDYEYQSDIVCDAITEYLNDREAEDVAPDGGIEAPTCRVCDDAILDRLGAQAFGADSEYHNYRCGTCGAGGTLVKNTGTGDVTNRVGPAFTGRSNTHKTEPRMDATALIEQSPELGGPADD